VDGVTDDVDMRSFLSDPRIDNSIFEPQRDPGCLCASPSRVRRDSVPNGADLASDAMYDAIREYSVWVLD
jgi:hypothetical protein